MLKTSRSLLLLAILLLATAASAQAQTVTIAWDPNDEPDIAGYVVFYGTSSGVYTWNQPVGNVTSATISGLTPGRTYYFAVQAVDSSGLASVLSQEVSTTIPGVTPACSITPSATAPTSGVAGGALAFQASATAAWCGPSLTYAWSFGDGSTASGSQVSHTYQAAGVYTWTMTVASGSSTASRTGTVNVSAAPTCSITPSATAPTSGVAGGALAFQASATASYCGPSLTYAWSFGDSSTASGSQVSHTYRAAGVYTWTMTVASGSYTASRTGTVNVSAAAPTPACSITPSATAPTSGAAGGALAFQASATAAWCGPSLTYAWSFGDGSTASGSQVSHTYQAAGVYTWTMTVASGSSTASRTGTVNVSAATGCSAVSVPVSATAPGQPGAVWQSTGVTVNAGGALTITPSGTWTNGGQAWTAAGNASDVAAGANCPMSGAPRMALIGRIGASGTPFLVGAGYQGTATATGTLYLAPNDDWYLLWDNAGSLNASICGGAGSVAQPTPPQAPSDPTATTTATISAATTGGVDSMWQSAGVTVTAGSSLTITAAPGASWVGGGQTWTADGNPSDPTGSGNSPMAGAPRMALVGRIGGGAPFLVGANYSGTATASGALQLAPNDDWYLLWDNSGSLGVSIGTGAAAQSCQVQATATAPATGLPGTAVVFTSTASATACSSSVTYDWSFGDGSTHSTESNPVHAYQAAGNYSWSLTVQAGTASVVRSGSITVSSTGGSSDTTVTVSITAAPPSSAMWQSTGVTVAAGDTLSISSDSLWRDAGQAFTADGQAGTLMVGANTPMSGAPLMALVGRVGETGTPFLVGRNYQATSVASGVLFLAPNDYWYELWDNTGALSVVVSAGAGSSCSVQATGSGPASVVAGAVASFSGGATTNCGGTVSYSWDFGDGTTASSQQNPRHIYAQPGTYTWTLTARDGTVTTRRSGSIAVRSNGSCTSTSATVQAATTGGLNEMWQSSGISVTAGVPVTVSASGSWMNGAITFSADGDSRQTMSGANAPLAGAPFMSLVGRVGPSGTPFKVGSSLTFTPSASGVLFFATNDNWYTLWDNSGSLAVLVCR